jgi:hypothetical protein
MIGEEDTIPPGFLGSDRSINESRHVSTCLPIRENQSIPQNATSAHCHPARRNVEPQQMNEYRTMTRHPPITAPRRSLVNLARARTVVAYRV